MSYSFYFEHLTNAVPDLDKGALHNAQHRRLKFLLFWSIKTEVDRYWQNNNV
jgi:hypothetical protein